MIVLFPVLFAGLIIDWSGQGLVLNPYTPIDACPSTFTEITACASTFDEITACTSTYTEITQ